MAAGGVPWSQQVSAVGVTLAGLLGFARFMLRSERVLLDGYIERMDRQDKEISQLRQDLETERAECRRVITELRAEVDSLKRPGA